MQGPKISSGKVKDSCFGGAEDMIGRTVIVFDLTFKLAI